MVLEYPWLFYVPIILFILAFTVALFMYRYYNIYLIFYLGFIAVIAFITLWFKDIEAVFLREILENYWSNLTEITWPGEQFRFIESNNSNPLSIEFESCIEELQNKKKLGLEDLGLRTKLESNYWLFNLNQKYVPSYFQPYTLPKSIVYSTKLDYLTFKYNFKFLFNHIELLNNKIDTLQNKEKEYLIIMESLNQKINALRVKEYVCLMKKCLFEQELPLPELGKTILHTSTPHYSDFYYHLPISTDRLIIRHLVSSDSDMQQLHEIWKQGEVMFFYDTFVGAVESVAEVKDIFQKDLKAGHSFYLGIFTKDENGIEKELIGNACVNIADSATHLPSISHAFKKEVWNCGYGSEYLKAFVEWWWKLPRYEVEKEVYWNFYERLKNQEVLELTADHRNKGSIRIAEKAGFICDRISARNIFCFEITKPLTDLWIKR